MPIYTGDQVNVGGRTFGEKLEEDAAELRLEYRMARSITSGGVSYVFSHTDAETGEAAYLKADSPLPTPEPRTKPERPARAHPKIFIDEGTRVGGAVVPGDLVVGGPGGNEIPRSELPSNAVLDRNFVGRSREFGGRPYRLWQSGSVKCEGKFIYVPSEE